MAKRLHSLCAALLALLLLLAPVRALAAPAAQAGALDPDTVMAIEDAAVLVFARAGGAGAARIAATPVDEPVVELTPEPTLEPTAEPTAEPTDEPAGDLGILAPSEPVLYELDNFSVELPGSWPVEDESLIGSIAVEDADSGFNFEVENLGEEAPGLIYVPIFEEQMGAIFASMGAEVEVLEPSRFVSADGLPGLRLDIANVPDETYGLMDGAIFILPTGDTAYGIYAVAPSAIWSELEPLVDDAVHSITFAPGIVTIQNAGEEPLRLYARDESYSIELAAGWYGSTTNDDQLSIVFADPDVKVVGAGGVFVTDDPNDPTLTALIDAIAGALSPEESAEMIANLLSTIDIASSMNVDVDDSLTTVLPSQAQGSLGIVRIVGDAPIQDIATMAITVYFSIYSDRIGAFVFFGHFDQVSAREETILQLIDSIEFAD